MSKSLYSVTPDPFTGGGIFTALQALDPPWADEEIAAQLDLIYYGNISGSKLVSPLVERLMTGYKLSAVETATLAGALMATNGARWSREWATRSAQYDPIENYRMVEEMVDDETVTEYGRQDTRTDNLAHGETRTDNLAHSETRTDNLQHSETRTDNLQHSETRTDNLAHSETRTDNLSRRKTGTETSTPDVTVTENNDVYGFNSSSAVHDSKRTQSSDGTSTTTYNLTETDTGTVGTQGSDTGTQSTQGSNTGTVGTQGSNTGTQGISGSDTGTQSTQGTDTGTQTNVASGSDTSTRNYQLTRSGNIGVTTSQQMLQSERDLWMWSFFYDVVFPDVDTVLTIPIYAEADDSESPGAIVPTGTIAIIANGDYDVARYAAANVTVPNTYTAADENKVVSDGQLVSQTAGFITSNGTHNTLLIGSVDVDVPNSYTAEDEGKVVSGGALVAQTGPLEITNNGVFDTTLKNEVAVNVRNGIPAATFNGVGLIIFNPSQTNCAVCLYAPYSTGSDTPSIPARRIPYMTFEQLLNLIKTPAFSQMCLYNYVNDAFIAGFGLELICTNLNGAKTTDEISRPITEYAAIFMDSCYNGNVNDSYSTSQIYVNPEVNVRYYTYMKDRNSSYTASLIFTDETHLEYGNSKQTRLYGLLKSV